MILNSLVEYPGLLVTEHTRHGLRYRLDYEKAPAWRRTALEDDQRLLDALVDGKCAQACAHYFWDRREGFTNDEQCALLNIINEPGLFRFEAFGYADLEGIRSRMDF